MSSIRESDWGTIPDTGTVVKLYSLTNAKGSCVEIITYGASLRAWKVYDKSGSTVDIVLGYDHLEGYLYGEGYLGNVVGRVCNRIQKGKFTLNGKEYTLAVNNGPNHLHGGLNGFSHKVWNSEIVGDNSVRLSCHSPSGEEGYPGSVDVTVTYTLTQDNQLTLQYCATVAEEPTPINLTNHAYFNLAGEGNTSIADHVVQIMASEFLVTDEHCLATGEIKKVEGTAFDFRSPVSLGERMKPTQTLTKCACPGGYDNCYCLTNNGQTATVAKTGLQLEVATSLPGLQFYTANFLDQVGKQGKEYGKHSSFCVETQGYPDAVNQAHFPSVILSPGEEYLEETVYTCHVADS